MCIFEAAMEDVKELFSNYYKTAKSCAAEVVKRCEGNERDAFLKDLDTAICDVAAVELAIHKEIKILSNIEREINTTTGTEYGDLSQIFQQKLAKQSTKDVTNSKDVVDYRSHVESLINSSELQSMIVMTSECNIDPFTKRPIEHPVKSKVCNHIFDKTSVMEVIAARTKSNHQCPYMGCQQWFGVEDLIDVSTGDPAFEDN